MPFLLLWHPKSTGTTPVPPTPTAENFPASFGDSGAWGRRRKRDIDQDDEDILAMAGFALTTLRRDQ